MMGRIIAKAFPRDEPLPFGMIEARAPALSWYSVRELDGEEAHIVDAVAFMRGNRAYFEDFITRSTYHSNAIEGSTLSYAETYAILWNDNSLQVTATARELYEAINHKYALSLALEEMQVTLSERLVKRIAQAINKNINEIGGYRTISVLIRGAEHLPPKPNQVNQLMMQLVHEYNHADDVDPYLREARSISGSSAPSLRGRQWTHGRILVNRGLLQAGLVPSSFRSSAAPNICDARRRRFGWARRDVPIVFP